jgi:hypothetical protein
MNAGRRRLAFAAGTVFFCAIIAGVVITFPTAVTPSTTMTGAVLRQSKDPRGQTPIEDAEITATNGLVTATAKSDVSGFFRVTLSPGVKAMEAVTLKFRHSGYQPLDITEFTTDQIYIARLVPISDEATPESPAGEVTIRDLRVRYSIKTTATLNVGSIAKTFEVPNARRILCHGQAPCSPDGKWKAAMGSVSYDAGEGNEFHDLRVSCIAGPCPFTNIESDNFSNPGRTVKVSVLNWSDTTTFLVEAEVSRTLISDTVRYSIPFHIGNEMNFGLPPAAEGLSIEANVNGSDIVFPVGPNVFLSWAVCTVRVDVDRSKLFRCELKPGYRFAESEPGTK